jgi:hypothetical protein
MNGRVVDLAEITGFACSVEVGLWEIAMEIVTRTPECEPALREILEEFEQTMQNLIDRWVT